MAGLSFDDLIPGADTISSPGISVSPPTPPAGNPHPMFADLVPGAASTGNPNLPSSQSASISPPDAVPSPGDDGRSFVLRQSSGATPDAPTWIGRRIQDIQGRQDPLYSDVPTVFSQNRDLLQAPMGSASMLGVDDNQMADVVKQQLGDRFISTFKDANGYPIVRFKDANGQPALGYVNKPGLDSEDVVRGVKSALPYAAGAEILGPLAGSFPTIGRVLAQGLLGGGTSIGGDIASKSLGNQQGIDVGKAGAMTSLGVLGEGAAWAGGKLWQKFVQIPRYFDKSSGTLTPLGRQAAQSMGLDPDQMMSDAMATFGKTYAMDPAAAKAQVDAGNFDFNIPVTRGQLAKDPQQLLQEKAMRSRLYGYEAERQIKDLDRRQADTIGTAVSDTIPSRLAGQPWRGGQPPAAYGDNIGLNFADARANAEAAENAAWKQASTLAPKTTTTTAPNAMTPMTGVQQSATAMQGADLLKDTLRDNLSDFATVLSPENTPTTFKMWSYLNDFMAGRKPSSAMHASLGLSGRQDIDAVRRGLGLMLNDAQTPTDQAAAKSIYRGFNEWIDKAASQNLLAGDPVAAANLKAARDVSREMNSIFKPMVNGRLTPGGQILERISKSADTPERIVNAIIPSPNAQIPAGTIEALNLIRRGMQKYGAPGADGQVWNSIKMAYLAKLTQGANGVFLSPQVMSQNLRKAMNGQKTLFDTIYSASDKTIINRFLAQLDKVNWKDPNPSGTATSVFGLGKQLFGKFFDAFGPLGRAAFERSGLQQAWGTAIAREAVKQPLPTLPRFVAPNALFARAPGYGNALAAPFVIGGNPNDLGPPPNALMRRPQSQR